MTALKLPRGRILRLDSPVVMGILNVTPDSFSDGGSYCQLDSAVKQAKTLLNQGCLLYTSPSPRDRQKSRMPSSA